MILIEETDDRFYIKESTLKDAGMGVFTKVPIKEGSLLEIIGVAVKIGTPASSCTEWAKHYKFAARSKDFDRHIIPLGYAAIVNHTSDRNLQNVEIRCFPEQSRKNPACGQMFYRFVKDVEADEEVLTNYGKDSREKMEWIEKNTNFDHIEWERFLSHDLYNLGLLTDKINIYKE